MCVLAKVRWFYDIIFPFKSTNFPSVSFLKNAMVLFAIKHENLTK